MRTELFYDKRLIAVLVAIVGLVSYALMIGATVLAEDYVYPNGGLVGGDHIAFWTAGRAALDGTWTQIYDPAAFEAALLDSGIDRERLKLTWQYPPHSGLVLMPFGALPLTASWAVWCVLSLAVFAAALRRAGGAEWRIVILALLSPALFQVAFTGQTGALAAAAMIGALALPDRRPVVAGICAGLLTMKPQLGLLIPFAYVAAGHWRSAAVAAATAGALVAASVLAFGPGAWRAFHAALTGVAEGVGAGAYPLQKMVTVFAALRSGGVPEGPAFALQAGVFVLAAALTVRIWRSAAGAEARAALTACLVFLTTPYAYYYDTALLTLPFLFVLSRLEGVSAGRRVILYLVWMTPTWIPIAGAVGAQLGLAAVIVLTLLTLRAAAPQTRFGLAPA